MCHCALVPRHFFFSELPCYLKSYVTCKSEHSSAIHELLLLVTGRRWSSKRCRRSAANCTATARRTTSSHTRWTSRCIGRCACSFSLSSSSLQLYYTVRFSLVCASTSAPVHVRCQFCLAAPPSNSWRTAVGSPPACRPRKLTQHGTTICRVASASLWMREWGHCSVGGLLVSLLSRVCSSAVPPLSLPCACARPFHPIPSFSRRPSLRPGPPSPLLTSRFDSTRLRSRACLFCVDALPVVSPAACSFPKCHRQLCLHRFSFGFSSWTRDELSLLE